MNEYTDHAVTSLDEAGAIIANKNIMVDIITDKLVAAEARIKGLEKELAAAQAREQQLREALISAEYALDECRDYPLTYSDVIEALTLPPDTTALESLIAKAGEVMREKCIPASFKQFLSDVHTAAGLLRYGKKDQGLADRLGKGVINYMTQTVRTVTLEDLK